MLLISAALVDNLAEKVDQQVSDIMTKNRVIILFLYNWEPGNSVHYREWWGVHSLGFA